MKFIIFIGIFLSTILIACSIWSSSGYLRRDFEIRDEKGDVSAVILLGAYVKDGKVTAWTDCSTGEIFRTSERDLEYGYLYNSHIAKYTGTEENGLKEVTIAVSAGKNELAPTMYETIAEIENSYYEHCSSCHAAPIIKHYPKIQWHGIMDSMIHHASMEDKESEDIKRYIFISLQKQ
ncbi:hypothetical protein Dacet_2617 [Denitrovibrio acetiphilus DSM 12809]|uniref:Uncharacterized protein n=1 Tax=Denitrovibrio acetiphilus (strain DSM 12809 / NBRC 114555 / N2460) TaxID=522772 RepID=D4H519_DENA2|nr:hypothetical protein [Denitrovibrio acetiphilus]ADD69375.1 hypothetical protein Dacet_2617 [Denitrovibrio acetiphilus DSM 12809]